MSAIFPEFDVELTRKLIIEFIRNTVYQAGFHRAVVGVSGGIDSALTCFLTAEALGPENVTAFIMPYKHTPPQDIEHAQMVIEATGVHHKLVEITDVVDTYLAKVPDADRIRRGNVMARVRMITLFDHAHGWNALVAGTGNKTEWLLGYTTLYGDAAASFLPIGDLYKTQVRILAREIGVPEPILHKPPSAGLWPGQTDEGELGFTYEEVDKFLYLWWDRGWTPQRCVDEGGISPQVVERALEWVHKNAFKRRLPPVAQVTQYVIKSALETERLQ